MTNPRRTWGHKRNARGFKSDLAHSRLVEQFPGFGPLTHRQQADLSWKKRVAWKARCSVADGELKRIAATRPLKPPGRI